MTARGDVGIEAAGLGLADGGAGEGEADGADLAPRIAFLGRAGAAPLSSTPNKRSVDENTPFSAAALTRTPVVLPRSNLLIRARRTGLQSSQKRKPVEREMEYNISARAIQSVLSSLFQSSSRGDLPSGTVDALDQRDDLLVRQVNAIDPHCLLRIIDECLHTHTHGERLGQQQKGYSVYLWIAR